MAFRLKIGSELIGKEGEEIVPVYMPCYDTLDNPDFYVEWDDLLHYRSAFEFVREQLTASQQAELDAVDEYWRAHAADFNAAFGIKLNRRTPDNAMARWVADERGNVPEIPASHWWWRVLPEGEAA